MRSYSEASAQAPPWVAGSSVPKPPKVIKKPVVKADGTPGALWEELLATTTDLGIAVPGGIEDFFRDAGRPAEGPGLPPEGPIDVAALAQAAARHGNEFVGPPLGVS